MRARGAALLAACICVLAIVPESKSANAGEPSGEGWTAIIAGGAAATYEFGYRLPVFAAKLRGTVREAEATARAPYDSTAQGSYVVTLAQPPEPDSVTLTLPGTAPVPCATPNAQVDEKTQLTVGQCVYTVATDGSKMTLHYGIGGAASLDEVRARIIQTVAFMPKGAPKGQTPKEWRRPYEALRTCWNRLIYVEPPPEKDAPAKPDASPSEKPKALASVTPSPSPAPLIAPGNCAAGIVPDGQPLDIIFAGQYVDLVDAAAAFTSAPSLRRQIVDQRVGTYRSENLERGEVLARLGGAFAATSPAAVPVVRYRPKSSGPFGAHAEVAASGIPGEINAGYTSCVVKFAAYGCFSALATAETSLESSLATAAACRFARRYWLPPVGTIAQVYSAQMIASAAPDYWPFPTDAGPATVPASPSLAEIENETRFGSVPGC